MLIVQGAFCINIDAYEKFEFYEFDVKVSPKGYSHAIRFIRGEECEYLIFETEEERYTAFKDILFAYQEGLRVFALIEKEEKKV